VNNPASQKASGTLLAAINVQTAFWLALISSHCSRHPDNDTTLFTSHSALPVYWYWCACKIESTPVSSEHAQYKISTETATVDNIINASITVSHGSAYTVDCCKGDAASQWEMAILGVSELRNPEPID